MNKRVIPTYIKKYTRNCIYCIYITHIYHDQTMSKKLY